MSGYGRLNPLSLCREMYLQFPELSMLPGTRMRSQLWT